MRGVGARLRRFGCSARAAAGGAGSSPSTTLTRTLRLDSPPPNTAPLGRRRVGIVAADGHANMAVVGERVVGRVDADPARAPGARNQAPPRAHQARVPGRVRLAVKLAHRAPERLPLSLARCTSCVLAIGGRFDTTTTTQWTGGRFGPHRSNGEARDRGRRFDQS